MAHKSEDQEVWDLIKDAQVGMLITRDGRSLRARPMQLVQKNYEGKIWFFTRVASEKVLEALGEDVVCLTFSEPRHNTYVSLSGVARLSYDRKLMDGLWNSFTNAWFPEGVESPDVALLEIEVYQGEYWKPDENKILRAYELAKANYRHQLPDIGKNQKFDRH
ncbi:MAG TPA: pyridoxamine 5'-phosphate oxidase family protein [Spongiibacteraceae bacterium]|jgi:general stress protein 26|nr:pyridoxamine 5'-phosphate oxidase family protein [Spongiibacteraceae bacterium]HUH37397.1 pyridoxamine 5'-phosphate oxidase family protein [Spongiibacteraceae bacterium]